LFFFLVFFFFFFFFFYFFYVSFFFFFFFFIFYYFFVVFYFLLFFFFYFFFFFFFFFFFSPRYQLTPFGGSAEWPDPPRLGAPARSTSATQPCPTIIGQTASGGRKGRPGGPGGPWNRGWFNTVRRDLVPSGLERRDFSRILTKLPPMAMTSRSRSN